MPLESPAQRWAQVSGPPRAGGAGGGTSASVSSRHLSYPLPALSGLAEPRLPLATALCGPQCSPFPPCAGVKAKKPIQTKFRMPLLNWVALKPSQITGTVFTELNDEKVLQVSAASLAARVGTREGRDLPGSCWALWSGHLHPFYRRGRGGPGMGIQPNWISDSSRQRTLTPREVFPSIPKSGLSPLF